MRRLRTIWRRAKALCAVLTTWLVFTTAALAQAPGPDDSAGPPGSQPETTGGSGGGYVVPYMVLLLGIFLGMLVICQSSRRRDRAQPEKYEKKNLLEED